MAAEQDRSPDDVDQETFDLLLEGARSGNNEAIGRLIESCRQYLLLVANQDMDKQLRRKIGASDLVQESLMTAQVHFDQFEGTSQKQLIAWLRKILINDIRETRRNFTAVKKRQLHREMDLDGSAQIGKGLVDSDHTPQTRAALNEQHEILEAALKGLPDDYQQVLRMRNWQHQTYEEIAGKMDRTPDAVRKLWARAVLRLQEIMQAKLPTDSHEGDAHEGPLNE